MSHARGGWRLALNGLFVGVTSVAAMGLGACIIAEPVSDLPTVPTFRPVIVRSSLVPPPSAVVGSFPEKFVVPVELVDPNVSFAWRLYVDYNPITGEGLDSLDTSAPSATPERIRVLEVQTRPPADLTRCHVIEFLVALAFDTNLGGKGSHTPKEPGGDSVTWFYSPNGDFRGCPVADSGVAEGRDAGATDGEGGS
jgi:hypothetical protein